LSSTKSLRILVVEDEILIALELESLLQDAGHTVVGIAASSREAVETGSRFKPDLAFVDIHLADGPTGVDVARRLNALGITVLFMTANAKRIPEDSAGALGVISKPYTERGVRQALDYAMKGSDRAQARPTKDSMTFIPFEVHARGETSTLS
jgi:two-component system, response regulator PdtaR